MLMKCPNGNCGWEATSPEEAVWTETNAFCPICGRRMVDLEEEGEMEILNLTQVKKTQVFRHTGFVLSTIWEGFDRPLREWMKEKNFEEVDE